MVQPPYLAWERETANFQPFSTFLPPSIPYHHGDSESIPHQDIEHDLQDINISWVRKLQNRSFQVDGSRRPKLPETTLPIFQARN